MIVVEVEVVVGEGEVEVEMQGRLMTIQRGVEMSQIRLFFLAGFAFFNLHIIFLIFLRYSCYLA